MSMRRYFDVVGWVKNTKRFGSSPYILLFLSAEPENRTPDLRNELRNEMDECNSLDYYTIWSRSVEGIISNIARLRTRLGVWVAWVVWVLCGSCRWCVEDKEGAVAGTAGWRRRKVPVNGGDGRSRRRVYRGGEYRS